MNIGVGHVKTRKIKILPEEKQKKILKENIEQDNFDYKARKL